MADIVTVAAKVRPLTGAVVRRYAASASLTVGQAVYVHTDGTIKAADADAVASAQARGILVAVGIDGATSAASGDLCDVVVFGPVAVGVTGLTEGAVVYVSTTAGAMDQTASVTTGDFNYVVGWVEADDVIFVQPQMTVPAAV